jgi:hypothetical protein
MLFSACEFLRIGSGKAVRVRLYREAVWRFVSKERPGKVRVLRHGVHSVQQC